MLRELFWILFRTWLHPRKGPWSIYKRHGWSRPENDELIRYVVLHSKFSPEHNLHWYSLLMGSTDYDTVIKVLRYRHKNQYVDQLIDILDADPRRDMKRAYDERVRKHLAIALLIATGIGLVCACIVGVHYFGIYNLVGDALRVAGIVVAIIAAIPFLVISLLSNLRYILWMTLGRPYFGELIQQFLAMRAAESMVKEIEAAKDIAH